MLKLLTLCVDTCINSLYKTVFCILDERAISQLNILGQCEQFLSSYILTLVGKRSKIVDELFTTHHP